MSTATPRQEQVGTGASRPWRRTLPLVPPILACAYPWLLQLARYVVALPQQHGPLAAAAWATISLLLMLAAPLSGLGLALHLSNPGRQTQGELRLRAIATLVLIAPPLYTLVGVETWLTEIANTENTLWLCFWLPVVAVATRAEAQRSKPAPVRPPRPGWRVSHGVGAVVLLSGFISLHLGNHVLGLINAETHLHAMQVLRHWYRNAAIEPLLIFLCAAQLITGAMLARRWLARAIDAARCLQAVTGVYLGLYLVCHLNSVFVYARAAGIETDFWFASGGPAGLMGDAWNVRLIPHYGLAVLFLFVHLGAGLRMVLLTHGSKPRWVMPSAWAAGALVAIAALLPLLRVHLT